MKKVILLFLLIISIVYPRVSISNPIKEDVIYVLIIENETYVNQDIKVITPSQKIQYVTLKKGQAQINATETGIWKIYYNEQEYTSTVSPETIINHELNENNNLAQTWPILAAILLFLVIAILSIYLIIKSFDDTEIKFTKQYNDKNNEIIITIINSNKKLTNVEIVDILPQKYYQCSITPNTEKNNILKWNLETINPHQSKTIKYKIKTSNQNKPAKLNAVCDNQKIQKMTDLNVPQTIIKTKSNLKDNNKNKKSFRRLRKN